MAATEKGPKPVANKAHFTVSLATSSPTISLSTNPTIPSLQLIVTARIVSSTYPASAITLCSIMSILDNGQHERHDGLFWGAIGLQSTTDPKRTIQIAFEGHATYGSKPDRSSNLREQPWMRFETIPPIGQSALTIKHDITLERLFRYSRHLKAADVRPGEKFRISMYPKRAFRSGWWTFGDMDGDLKGKKFAEWELPDEDEDIRNLGPGEKWPDFQQMEIDGWVFSQRLHNLEITEDDAGHEVVVEFVK